MGHKVDLAEVISFSDKVAKAADEVSLDTDVARNNIMKIDSMNTFTGHAAKSAKGYLNDLHVTLLDSFDVLHTVMKDNLKDHIDTFKSSVDTSDEAIVQTEYLNQTKVWVEIDHKNIVNSAESVKKSLDDISDIVYIRRPSLEDAISDYDDMMETIEKLDENLNTFTTKGKKDDSLEKDLLDNIKVVLNKANASKGAARFKEYKHGKEGSAVAALRQTVGYVDKGASVIDKHLEEKKTKRQNNKTNKPKDPGIKSQGKTSIWSKAKGVGGKFVKGIKDSVVKMGGGKAGIPNRILGPAGGLLNYNANYQSAKDQGKTGFGAAFHAAEDTAIDLAIGSAVMVGATAAVTATVVAAGVTAPAAVVAGAAIIVGVGIGKLLDIKFGKTKKSVTDRIKGGYRKIKGWFK